ncbi:MAG: hypothetical protein QM733_14545 [Ilumatobacteraceae bacterium]
MAEETTETTEGAGRKKDDELFDKLEDRLESFKLLADSSELQGPAERDILATLATADRPLADPDGFEQAHRVFVRALEALQSNGRRQPKLPARFGPVKTAAAPLVSAVTGWIVTKQINGVLGRVRKLYEMREANAVFNSPEHRKLRRARQQMHMLVADMRSASLGLPVFLISGAFISGLLSWIQNLLRPVLSSTWSIVVLVIAVAVMLVAVSLFVLLAASIARTRIRLALDQPLRDLFDAIGSAGSPPRDQSYQVAVFALAFFTLAAIVVPAGLVLLYNL